MTITSAANNRKPPPIYAADPENQKMPARDMEEDQATTSIGPLGQLPASCQQFQQDIEQEAHKE
jgi:hypothetical protein